ncbi:MAG: SDR family oxidoreductase [Proteobacteria bacterium]|nr:SDR family oxidoreductase [Pseudomonadota bacterium]
MIYFSLPKVFITGSAKRIGQAIALYFAQQKWDVIIHYNHSFQAALDLEKELLSLGVQCWLLQADLSKESEVHLLNQQIDERIGPYDCLINNASCFLQDSVNTSSRHDWDQHFETNLRTPFVLCQHFAKQLPHSLQGNIINIIDQRVWNLTPYFISYTLSKVGLWALTQMLALSLAPRIRVNGIGPGPTLPSIRQTQKEFEKQVNSIPLKCASSPKEIAQACYFITKSPSLTGQMIALDGGQHLGWSFPHQPSFINE